MAQFEIVRRKGKGGIGETVYLRRRPWGRTLDEASKGRLDAMLTFAQAAWEQYGGNYEDIPNAIKQAFKKRAPMRRVKERTITMTPDEYIELRRQMLRRGIGRLTLPAGYKLEIKPIEIKPRVVAGGGSIPASTVGKEEGA